MLSISLSRSSSSRVPHVSRDATVRPSEEEIDERCLNRLSRPSLKPLIDENLCLDVGRQMICIITLW